MTFISCHILLSEFHMLWQRTGMKNKKTKNIRITCKIKECNTEGHTNYSKEVKEKDEKQEMDETRKRRGKKTRNVLFIVILHTLLTPWSRVLLEQLTALQLVKKLPAFYGTRTFITAVTSDRNLSLPIQVLYYIPTVFFNGYIIYILEVEDLHTRIYFLRASR